MGSHGRWRIRGGRLRRCIRFRVRGAGATGPRVLNIGALRNERRLEHREGRESTLYRFDEGRRTEHGVVPEPRDGAEVRRQGQPGQAGPLRERYRSGWGIRMLVYRWRRTRNSWRPRRCLRRRRGCGHRTPHRRLVRCGSRMDNDGRLGRHRRRSRFVEDGGRRRLVIDRRSRRLVEDGCRGGWLVEDGCRGSRLVEDGRCGLGLAEDRRGWRWRRLMSWRGNELGLGRSALSRGRRGSRLHGGSYRTAIRIQDDVLRPDMSIPPPKTRVIDRIWVPPGRHH